ncbi:protein crumbs homolog 3a [Denticeps clupeoides]|uniref:Uncharacterized protein n=1 Tax=Denticeps clupeoides TaxID=299321 RepID=A0AAY4BPK3_9TELE|nr:protein crumbs homolog 3 [Denticeps clupeoides]
MCSVERWRTGTKMALERRTVPHVGLLLSLRSPLVRADNSTASTATPETSPNVVAIVVPIVVCLVVILIAVGVYLFFVVRSKRQTEGTYRPSAEEQTGTRSVEMPDALKLPKEERLI